MMALTIEEEIVQKLKKKDLSKHPFPISERPRIRALWALEVVQDETDNGKVTAKAIKYIIAEIGGKHVRETAIIKGLASAPGYTTSTKDSVGKCYYSIAGPGRSALRAAQSPFGQGVLFFTGNEAWTDLQKLGQLLTQLNGSLCIVDNYFAEGTLQILSKFGKNRDIRFITGLAGRTGTLSPSLQTELTKFKGEFPKIKIRKYQNPDVLHDRYIFSKTSLVLVGHGLKDATTKESFVVVLPAEKLGGFMKTITAAFESRWKSSQPL